MTTFYETLGVAKDADDVALKNARRRLAKIHHPDRDGGDEATMRAINQAYEVLSDAKRRKLYDETGSDEAYVSPAMRAQRGAAEVIMEILRNNPQSVKPLQEARQELGGRMQSAEHLAAQSQKQAELLDAQLARFKVKQGENMVAAAIIEQRDQLLKQAQAYREAKAEMIAIMAALDAYEYEVPPPSDALPRPRLDLFGRDTFMAALEGFAPPQWTSRGRAP